MNYANGTYIHYTMIRSARAICPDGRIRRTKRISQTSDTFFSIPASMTVKGKTVAGYITVETIASRRCQVIVKFVPYLHRTNGRIFQESPQ